MLRDEYQFKRDEMLEQYNAMDPFAAGHLLRRFMIFSANLGNFLPQCPLPDHLHLFKQLCINQHLSKLDQEYSQFLNHADIQGWDSDFTAALNRKPGIICTFHTGSYRIINQLLARAALPFTLVVSNAVIEREGNAFRRDFQTINGAINRSAGFDLINAEMPNAMFKLMRAAKAGRTLLFYLDGNTGSGNRAPNDNLVCIDFFQDALWARKGIAVLSFLLKLPIYPVLNLRRGLNALQFYRYGMIQPKEKEEVEPYVKRTTRQLYGYLEEKLKDDPVQWECWLYLHLYRAVAKREMEGKGSDKPLLEEKGRWGMFSIKENRFLLDKRTYNTYKVTKTVYDRVYKEVLSTYSL